jgi:iron-sulfur cluster repair protein YtfE (RIC family)
MDVLEHLEEEHRKVEKMIAQLESSKSAQERRPVLAELGDSLATHMAVEEERVYPIIEEVLGSDKAREAQQEHDASRTEMATMVELIDSGTSSPRLHSSRRASATTSKKKSVSCFPNYGKRRRTRSRNSAIQRTSKTK